MCGGYARRRSFAQLMERIAAARGGGARPHDIGQLAAAVVARAKPINRLWPLVDERCTCRQCVRYRIACLSPCANGGFAQGLGLA